MAQFRTDTGRYLNNCNTIFEVVMGASADGHVYSNTNPVPISGTITTSNSSPITVSVTGTVKTTPNGPSGTSAFGEPLGLTITPVIQLDGIYGATSEVIQTYTSGTDSYAASNLQMFAVSSGTTQGGYGVLRSKRFLRYRAGQGALCRFTAMFANGVVGSSQRAGLSSQEQAIQFGYNGTRFGIMRATGAKAHITVLTINTAPTGSQTVTITLDGTAYTVSVGAGTTTATAATIAARVGGYNGWLLDQVDNTIVFMSSTNGPRNGTYSMSSSGTGTLTTGTFVIKQSGVAQTENWTYQNMWNVDALGANTSVNPSGMILRPHNLNVYQINYRWLGAGEIRYAVEDEVTGNMIFVHREHYVNQHTKPHIANPSFKIGYAAFNTTSTTSVTTKGASFMGAIEGEIKQNELNRSSGVSKTTLASGTLHHLMTVRNPYVTNGKSGALNGNYIVNAKEVILKDISIGTQGNDPGTVYIFFEATSFSGTHQYLSQPKDNAMVSIIDGTLDKTVDTAICRFVTAINGEAQYKLSDFRIAVPPGSSVSIGIDSTSNLSRVTAALVFSED